MSRSLESRTGQVRVCSAIGGALARYAELGLFAAGFSTEQGGLGLPAVVCAASYAWFAAANADTASYPLLTVANARLLAAFGSPAQFDTFARPEIDGRWFGTMCLSEPQAGSSLADVRTKAVPDGSDALGDRYRLFGNKMWITGGDQDVSENIVHLVLAKVPDADGTLPEGTAGALAVHRAQGPARRDAQRRHGRRAQSQARLSRHDQLPAQLRRGRRGDRLDRRRSRRRFAADVPDDERDAGQRRARRRRDRLSRLPALGRLCAGTAPGAPRRRALGRSRSIIEHPDVRRMLLQQKCYVEGRAGPLPVLRRPDRRRRARRECRVARALTPVAKTWPSEYGLAANDIAIQVHGGYGSRATSRSSSSGAPTG
jgi:alkylation response protein AidB-like acyl-CoA dehydrogenase